MFGWVAAVNTAAIGGCMNKEKIESVLNNLQICIKGMCSLCEYKRNCMDGLIDDCYNILEEIYENT